MITITSSLLMLSVGLPAEASTTRVTAAPAVERGTAAPAGAQMQRVALQSVPKGGIPHPDRAQGARPVQGGQAQQRFAVPYLTDDPVAVGAAKLRANQALARSAASGAPQPEALVVGVNWAGLSAADAPGGRPGSGTPPDTTGSIGPLNYVEFVNSLVAVYMRSGTEVSRTGLDAFVGFPGFSVFDPQIQYDPVGDRWFYAADVGMDVLAVGWSKTADPSDLVTGWCRFSAGTGLEFHDFPKLGHDDNFITIGVNTFTAGAFSGSKLWAIPKPVLGDASCTPPVGFISGVLMNADATPTFTPVPANTTDSSATGYIVSAHRPSAAAPATKVMVWHLELGGGGVPSLVADGDITVNAFAFSPDLPQPGTPFLIDTGDTRLTGAVSRKDPDAGGAQAVWTQHTVGTGGTDAPPSVVRWYEFLPATLTVRQQGEVQDPTDFIFNGAISPDSVGNAAAVNYNRGSAVLTPVLAAQSRTSLTPLGTMDPGETLLASSVDSTQDFSCNPPPMRSCRWGDYAAASPDPAAPGVVWGSGQVTGFPVDPVFGNAQWTTWNFSLSP
jgi:hypothetical protein